METVNLELETCTEPPPAPLTVRYVGKAADGSEPILLEATLEDPGWGAWRRTWRAIAEAGKDTSGPHPDSLLIYAVVKTWSMSAAPTLDQVDGLHPKVHEDLAKKALAIFSLKAAQIKNSNAPSI